MIATVGRCTCQNYLRSVRCWCDPVNTDESHFYLGDYKITYALILKTSVVEHIPSKRYDSTKMENLHWETQQWKSDLQFVQDEVMFIEQLLQSYVFEPNTPNLFERLQDYLARLNTFKEERQSVVKVLAKHENELGGMWECKDVDCNGSYRKSHEDIRETVNNLKKKFSALKSEIFNYAGGILKKRKA